VRDSEATIGGGSLPGEVIASVAIAVPTRHPERVGRALRIAGVIGRVQDGALLLDLRAVAPEEDARVVRGAARRWRCERRRSGAGAGEARVALAAADLQAVEVLEEGDHELAGQAGEVLEGLDVELAVGAQVGAGLIDQRLVVDAGEREVGEMRTIAPERWRAPRASRVWRSFSRVLSWTSRRVGGAMPAAR
jgi:hypothetical protein